VTVRRAELLRTLAVVASGLVIISIYAFPGYMAWDSVEQLAQARAGQLSNWHPPVMSALWGVFDRIVPGAMLMFLLQNTLFLVGLHVLLRRSLSPWRAAIATLVIFAWPPSLTVMAVIVKDSLMCGALLVACAGITSERRWARITALVAFALAAGLRHNAVAVVVPLLAMLSPWPATRGVWARRGAGAGIGVGLTVCAMLANAALTDVSMHPFHYSVAPMDIVATLNFAPDLTDAEVHELLPGVRFAHPREIQAHARSLYDPNMWWGTLLYGDDRLFDEPNTPELRDGVKTGWLQLIEAYPGAYVANRFHMMREMLGFTDAPWTAVYGTDHERSMLAGTYQPAHKRNVVQRRLSKTLVRYAKTSVTFRPYFYCALLIVLWIVMRRDRLIVALLVSALGYLALLVVISPSPDFRYNHWMIVVVLIGMAIRLLGRPGTGALRDQDHRDHHGADHEPERVPEVGRRPDDE